MLPFGLRRDDMPAKLSKGKQQVAEEIPQGGGTYGKHLAEVEVPFQLAVEQVDRQRVDAQPNQRDDEILDVFHTNLRIGALDSPDAVEDVVGGGGKDETEDVAQILVPFEPLLADVCDTEIDEHAREAHHAELQKLQQQLLGQFYFEQ